MGWSHGYEDGRHVGYGVQSMCDVPDCPELIDRGFAYRCAEGGDLSCGAFVCPDHNGFQGCVLCDDDVKAFHARRVVS